MEAWMLLGIILLIAGFILVGIEMILPGFSAPGISGIICLIAGIFVLADSIMEAAIITIAVLAVLGILMVVILGFISKGRLKTPIVLEDEQKRTDGYLSSSDLKYLLGKKGMAETDLRPSGVAKIDDIRFDVMSDGNYITRGALLEIIRVEGSKLVVREVNE